MRIRHGHNGLALILSGLALLVVTTGTAVAVTATVTTISDPGNASYQAHVDASGHLSTTGSTSTIVSDAYVSPNSSLIELTSPTRATLAITRLTLANPVLNSAYAGTTFAAVLYRYDTTNTVCDGTGSFARELATYVISPGDQLVDNLSSPIVVRPVQSKRYCIVVTSFSYGSNNSYYSSSISLGAFVISGTYNGSGSSARPASRPVSDTAVHHPTR